MRGLLTSAAFVRDSQATVQRLWTVEASCRIRNTWRFCCYCCLTQRVGHKLLLFTGKKSLLIARTEQNIRTQSVGHMMSYRTFSQVVYILTIVIKRASSLTPTWEVSTPSAGQEISGLSISRCINVPTVSYTDRWLKTQRFLLWFRRYLARISAETPTYWMRFSL